MTVTRERLEEQLAQATSRVRDPRHGLFGPDSVLWRVNREHAIFLGAGRAALLQEAHPFVAHGVDQHSLTRTDPFGRFERTFKNVYAMVFGDLDMALRAARRVHAIHARVRGAIAEASGAFAAGASYEANAEHALLWVHATLWDTSLMTYELLFGALSSAERERYYQETKLFAYMFGIGDAVLPPTFGDFMAYNRRMWASGELFVGAPARQMERFLLSAPRPVLEPAMHWYRAMTAALLPQQVREGYGLAYGRAERALFHGSLPALRAGFRALPQSVRYLPAYVAARARIGAPLQLSLADRVVVAPVVREVMRRAA